ncbi:hypothetical protein OHB54_45970 [Streptomyces sp. NBC_01007]|nr:hypothetical protein OHB54_00270 [Streptomyces sp. NBC_01007]WRZ95705.1 hypothetical protein OHB54_45970 [Streptomyces sp. NBC_01007]
MSDPISSWNILSQGENGELVIAVDFPASGRLQADFDELANRLPGGHAFWRTAASPTGLLSGISGDEYIKPWLDEVKASGKTVRGVLGYCVGSVYAALLAERIAEIQDEAPALILFDPELTHPDTVYWQFYMVVESLKQILSPEEAEQLREAGRAALEEAASIKELAEILGGRFHDAVAIACDRIGLGEEFVEELEEMFGAFLTYLSVAEQIDPLPVWARATALCSSAADNGLNRVRNKILHTQDKLVAEEVVFAGVEHADLLRTDDVAKATTELLSK